MTLRLTMQGFSNDLGPLAYEFDDGCPARDVITVPKGGNLQDAVDQAPVGATIKAYPDEYDGVILPERHAELTIQPDTHALDALARVEPDMADAMIRLRPNAGGTGSAIVTRGRASGYRLIGCQALPGDPQQTLVALGQSGITDPTDLPSELILDRCLIAADPERGGRRGIACNCRDFVCVRCHLDHFWHTEDAQGILGWSGPGPFLIENNFIAASGMAIMFGGADAAAPEVTPAHAIIRGNTLTKHEAWRTQAGAVVKNTFELKALRYGLIENNVIEYSWQSGQTGALVLFTPRNQDGAAPWSSVTDIDFRWNLVRHGAGGINLLGTDHVHPSGPAARIRITDCLFDDIGDRWGRNGRLVMLQGGEALTFARNTATLGPDNSFVSFDGPAVERLEMVDNILPEGDFGMMGTNAAPGTPSWDAFVEGGRFHGNVIQRGTSGRLILYPGTNTITAPAQSAVGPDFRPLPPYRGVGCNVEELLRRLPLTNAL